MRRRIPAKPTLVLGALYNELQGSNELVDLSIGVSLSGGGYRATLFAAGAITALCDAGLWGQVRWVASVSGGSFANAVAALHLSSAAQRREIDGFLALIVDRAASARRSSPFRAALEVSTV